MSSWSGLSYMVDLSEGGKWERGGMEGGREGREREIGSGLGYTSRAGVHTILEMIPFLAIFLQKCQDTDIEKTTSWGCGW